MTEKEQLIENIKEALPIAEKMQELEENIEQLEAKIAKSHVGCVLIGLTAFFLVCGIIELSSGGLILAIILGVVIAAKKGSGASAATKLSEVQQQYAAYKQCAALAWLPEKYRIPSSIAKIASYVRDGRVDTLKEAINTLEAELAQQRLEASAAVGAYIGAKQGRY